MIDEKRISEELSRMATITAPGRGINRLAFTDTDWEGRAYLMSLMKEAGLAVRTDAFGNIIGHLPGQDESLPSVMIGSHADSVPDGGNYDGIAGVLCGIEIARSMKEENFKNDRGLEVVIFACEESSRFDAGTLGSSVMRGLLSKKKLLEIHDHAGNSLYDVLRFRDLKPDDLGSALWTKPLAAMFEVHIEPGRYLEYEGYPLGIVTGITAPYRLRVHIHGTEGHSGATPMNLRHDGLAAAAEIILAVEHTALRTMPEATGTVTTLGLSPNAMNVIPGHVTLGIDIRSISDDAKDEIEAHILDVIRQTSRNRDLSIDVETLARDASVPISHDVSDFLLSTAQSLSVPAVKMTSGAGHDAMHFADYCPTGMLFFRSRGGISHAPEEYASLSDIMKAMRTMEQAVRRTCSKDFSFRK